ncbi:MAG TPA: hypothetical protein VH394_21530 [Thermoanaerobaculia bacterium]|jgi:hypothetical protein|nr:hypothetical protein [Thermoanaerobaculia bacterium]
MDSHPKAEQLIRFLEGRSEGAQARILIAHLLRGCPTCSATAAEFLRPKRKLPPNAYDAAFEKALLRIQPRRAPIPTMRNLMVRQGVPVLPGSPI